MKELYDSVKQGLKDRITNHLYGTFLLTWLVFHWNFIFSMIALDSDKILGETGLLKNEYLIYRYFNLSDLYFWASWIVPFILTYLIIWRFPKWFLLSAYNKTEAYDADKRIIKISQKRRIAQEEARLEEQTARKFTAVAKKVSEEKKIKETDPTIKWDEDYDNFKKLSFAHKFSKIIESYYKQRGDINVMSDFDNTSTFEIPEDMLAYSHSNDIVEIDRNSNKIELTEKGKYFVDKFLNDPNKPEDLPF